MDHLPGVSGVTVTGNTLTCQVRGSIDPLLAVLADAHPYTLRSREPSLEELFLQQYGEEEPHARTDGDR